jgi:hypothetical protein
LDTKIIGVRYYIFGRLLSKEKNRIYLPKIKERIRGELKDICGL